MSDFKILEPQSLMESVAAELRTRIHNGQLSPGDRLVESSLATNMGISRAPVREALRQLEYEGLVASRPRRGYVVRGLSTAELYEIYDLRMLLEPMLASEAAKQVSPDGVAALRTALDNMGCAAAADDLAGVVEADREFHSAIRRMSQRPLTAQIFDLLNDQVRRFTELVNRSYSNFDELIDEHEAILGGIASGDEAQAAKAMWNHLDDARRRLTAMSSDVSRLTVDGSGSYDAK